MKKAAPAPAISEADLRLALRDTIARLDKPTSPAELRKALPKPYQRPPAEITHVLADLAREGALFALKDGTAYRYSARDAAAVIAPALQAALREGPLDGKQLAAYVKRAAPGFEKMLPDVLAVEVARGAVREHPKASKQPLRYGLEPPDPTPFLEKTVKELQALAKKLAPHGITLASMHAALGRALGVARAEFTMGPQAAPNPSALARAPAPLGPDPRADEAAVLAALHELSSREPPGALLSVRGLRELTPLDKARFDGAVLRLSRAGELVLHHHDFPTSLPETERAALVQDERGVHYVGVALREEGRP